MCERPDVMGRVVFVDPHRVKRCVDDGLIQIIDASWSLPAAGHSARAISEDAYVPGSLYVNLDDVCAPATGPPHRMFPTKAHFESQMWAAGVRDDGEYVVYDSLGQYSAARLWWMMTAFGRTAFIMDGGLPAWRRCGFPVATGPRPLPTQDPLGFATSDPSVAPTRTWQEVLANVASSDEQLIDVRPAEMFTGDTSRLYPDVRPGHIPGAKNVPQRDFFDSGWRLKSIADIYDLFDRHGVRLDVPIIATCGSGVTACILAAILAHLGEAPCAIYDGSWEEWGGRHDLPAEQS